jgi:RNA-directed DNA polymerase
MTLHAKAKAEAGCRFYALYDKISREDILAHAYAQCRSNKGAPGVDGQDFADIFGDGEGQSRENHFLRVPRPLTLNCDFLTQ